MNRKCEKHNRLRKKNGLNRKWTWEISKNKIAKEKRKSKKTQIKKQQRIENDTNLEHKFPLPTCRICGDDYYDYCWCEACPGCNNLECIKLHICGIFRCKFKIDGKRCRKRNYGNNKLCEPHFVEHRKKKNKLRKEGRQFEYEFKRLPNVILGEVAKYLRKENEYICNHDLKDYGEYKNIQWKFTRYNEHDCYSTDECEYYSDMYDGYSSDDWNPYMFEERDAEDIYFDTGRIEW